MSRLRDFFIKVPGACGVKSPAWGEMNRLAFDHEVKNPNSIFARIDDEDDLDRIAPAFGFQNDPRAKPDHTRYAISLGLLAAKAYGLTKGVGNHEEVATLAEELALDEIRFPEISALLTVQEARTMTNWG